MVNFAILSSHPSQTPTYRLLNPYPGFREISVYPGWLYVFCRCMCTWVRVCWFSRHWANVWVITQSSSLSPTFAIIRYDPILHSILPHIHLLVSLWMNDAQDDDDDGDGDATDVVAHICLSGREAIFLRLISVNFLSKLKFMNCIRVGPVFFAYKVDCY